MLNELTIVTHLSQSVGNGLTLRIDYCTLFTTCTPQRIIYFVYPFGGGADEVYPYFLRDVSEVQTCVQALRFLCVCVYNVNNI